MSNTIQYDDPIEEWLAKKNESEAAQKPQGSDTPPAQSAVNADVNNQQIPPEQTPADTPPPAEVTPPASDVPPVSAGLDLNSLTEEQKFAVFKSMTGVDSTDMKVVQKFIEAYNKLPEYEKMNQIYPKVVEELKKKQNIMEYFPDDDTFKVVQMMKDPKYKGKESALYTLFREDVDKMNDLKVIELGASIEKSAKIANPLKSALRSAGLDADLVLEGEDLSDDDKDTLTELADQYRERLKELRTKATTPPPPADIEKMLLDLDANSKDDFEKRKQTVQPIAASIVGELKEIPVLGDFKFIVNMNDADKSGYVDFLTHSILSGEYDLSTATGKEELYDALLTEVFVDNKEKILQSYETHIRNKVEAEFRQKYNNDMPLNQNEPPVQNNEPKKNPVMDLVYGMINERL